MKKAKLDVRIDLQPEYLSKEWYEFCEQNDLQPYPEPPHKNRAFSTTSPYDDIGTCAIMYIGDGIPHFIDPDDEGLTYE